MSYLYNIGHDNKVCHRHDNKIFRCHDTRVSFPWIFRDPVATIPYDAITMASSYVLGIKNAMVARDSVAMTINGYRCYGTTVA